MLKLRLFVFRTLIFAVPQLALVTGLAAYFALSWGNRLPYQQLYRHQLDKLAEHHDCDTIFLGDSSLGNSLDAEYFFELTGSRTLNLALNGSYGYAGTYNMLKRAHARFPNLKNVIIVQTIDMPTRDVSYRGYLYTARNLADIGELALAEQLAAISSAYNCADDTRHLLATLGGKPKNYLENDYIRQNNEKVRLDSVVRFRPEEILEEQFEFVNKISDFSRQHGLNVVYVHGPCYAPLLQKSQTYLETVNAHIESLGIPVAEGLLPIPAEDLGNALDHVAMDLKRKYTLQYADILADQQLIPAVAGRH